MEAIHHIIMHYGYAGIFCLLMMGIVGLPVPDETLLAFCGYLAHKGELDVILTIVAAFAGSCCGISVSYLIGRVPGLALIRKYGRFVHVTEERFDRIHRWFGKGGKWLLVIGYFVPGIRHLTAMVAGSTKLGYPEFAAFAYAGALLWSTVFVSAGYFFGKEWEKMSGKAHEVFFIAAASLLLIVVGRWLVRFLRGGGERKAAP
jgi:membrane protein DedA with SNARE-associated domain